MSTFHIGSELRRFSRGKLPPLALAVIMLLPLLFGGLFVWSYWDPIGRLNNLPVAVINSDDGAEVNGEELNAGDLIVEKLLASGAVDFHETTVEEAQEGVANGTYYFAIEFPEDFSQAVSSVNTDNPHHATMNAVFNNTNGLLGTALGNQVVNQVLMIVNENLGEKLVDQLLVGFSTIKDNLGKAGDGAQQLADGAHTATDGAQKLDGGAGTLADGLITADDAAQQLADGSETLSTNLNTAAGASQSLADGMSQLNAATDRLGAGAGQISEGVTKLTGPAATVAGAQEEALTPLINLAAQLRSLNIPQATDLAQQADAIVWNIRNQGLGNGDDAISKLNQLSAGAQELHRQLTDPTAEYRAGLNRATDGARQLSEGVHKLSDGSERLVVGSRKLADGTSKLSQGAQQLTVGANQLASGMVRLDEGSGELALKLNQGAEQVPGFADGASASFATPVKEQQTKDELSLFGVGLAPMFISIGLFMGATVIFMLLRPSQRRAIDSGAVPIRGVMASYLPAIVVGIAQATIMFCVQRFALGLHAVHEFGLWASMCLISVAFIAITQGLNNIFGATVGRVLCLGLMTLQIVSSGGLYPPETQPAPLRWFHTIDPMTYSVNLTREMIFGIDAAYDDRAIEAALFLVVVMALFLTASGLSARRDRRWKMKDFRPEVSV
ncbi:MAG: YhgE/Pip domain-containing protein [Corynebacterium sp.]|uniref:YhgE/Pip domain-containing protein n=1 Tax=Corynebacterium sp. TaxID=1720 RepID=UPI0026DD64F9|nr:YhgE/Pip domain-containing protein [Corynebacterium sp.]MDO5097807.1 YhgE/Pip domain-containing protein [Corynebacterium sp.]